MAGRVPREPRERAAESRIREAAPRALSAVLGAKTAAEAGQGSRFASDGWSYQTRIEAKRLSGYRVWRNAAAVGVRRGKGRGQRTRCHFAAQPLGAKYSLFTIHYSL